LSAVSADETKVPTSAPSDAQKQIRELQRTRGKKSVSVNPQRGGEDRSGRKIDCTLSFVAGERTVSSGGNRSVLGGRRISAALEVFFSFPQGN
jgi:hypothetical protein